MKGMKLSVLVVALSCMAMFTADAQRNYSKFRGEIGLNGGYATGKMSGGGFGAYSEIKYNITDNISAGVRFGADLLLSGNFNSVSSGSVSVGAKVAASVLAKGEYYLTTSKVRPFAGLGMGLYSTGSSSASSDGGASVSAGNHFGVMPQFGVNFGAFRMALQYHIVTGKDQVVVVGGQTEEFGRNWLGLDIGFSIGGGRKAPVAE